MTTGEVSLDMRILATLAYADLFGAALPAQELRRRLYTARPEPESRIEAALRRLARPGGPVRAGQGGYSLGAARDPDPRAVSLAAVRAWARAVRWLPGVRFLGLTGALAKGSPDRDVDLFVVAARDRGFVAFALLRTIGRLAAARRGLSLCVNYVVEEDRLDLGPLDPFTAVEFVTLKPLMDDGAGRELWEANRSRISGLCANADRFPRDGPVIPPAPLSRLLDRLLAAAGGAALNRRLYRFKRARLRRKLGAGRIVEPNVRIEESVLKQHDRSHRCAVLDRFRVRLETLGLAYERLFSSASRRALTAPPGPVSVRSSCR